jgi:predicted deacylase
MRLFLLLVFVALSFGFEYATYLNHTSFDIVQQIYNKSRCFRPVTLSTEPPIVYVSTNNPQTTPKRKEEAPLRIAIVCGTHARELYSTRVCMKILERLEQDRQNGCETWDDEEMTRTPHQLTAELLVIPLHNPTGRDVFVSKEHGCYRVNSNGVDLNRNWPSVLDDERTGDRTVPLANLSSVLRRKYSAKFEVSS